MAGMARYRRHPLVSDTDLDGEIFLVKPGSDDVFYLDEITAGLWRLIAEPLTLEEVVSVYRDAFPGVDPNTVEADLRTALKTLLDRDLVEVVS